MGPFGIYGVIETMRRRPILTVLERVRTLLQRVDTRDWFVFGGLALMGIGAGLIYVPAGFLLVGTPVFIIGVFGVR